MLAVKKYPKSRFVPLSQVELEQVWQWRNQDEIRRNMHNDANISWQQHLAWFEQLQTNPKRLFFVFYQDERAIGVLNFNQRAINEWEWGCYLGENNVWPGSGLLLEIAALDYAAAQTKLELLYAEVLSFNHSVIKMHQIFGYQALPDLPGKTRDNQPYTVKTFQYPLAQWRANRTLILQRLPKQISAAADFISFLNQ